MRHIMGQLKINTSTRSGSIPQPGLVNSEVKTKIQQLPPVTEFPPGPKFWLNDKAFPHGALPGQTSEGVAAYSNDSVNSTALEPYRLGGIVTGLTWQCVEFARRWLLQTRGLIFADVSIASDLWNDVFHLFQVSDNKTVPLDSHPNGSHSKPVNGDLLIYSEAFLGTGHVAVVVGHDSDAGGIHVAEQNYFDRPWQGDYSRAIPLVEVDGRWWLLEPYLNGWKRIHQ